MRLSSSSFCELIKRSKPPSSSTRCLQPASCKAVTVPMSPIPKIEPLTQATYVSFLIYHNIDVVSIARLVGHKDATETLQTYAHLFERRQDEVFELVRKII